MRHALPSIPHKARNGWGTVFQKLLDRIKRRVNLRKHNQEAPLNVFF
jgi:hypothetical protein